MSTDIHSNQPLNQAPGAAGKFVHQATDTAKEIAGTATAAGKHVIEEVEDLAGDFAGATRDTCHTLASKVENGVERTKEYAQHAVDVTKDAAKDMYHSAALRAENSLANSKEYVRRNPVLVVAGALAFGAAVGCLIMMARRQPTFRERYVDEPLDSARDAILTALAPVTQRLHDGYDSARDGAGRAMNRMHRIHPGRTMESLSDQIARVGSNLKFW